MRHIILFRAKKSQDGVSEICGILFTRFAVSRFVDLRALASAICPRSLNSVNHVSKTRLSPIPLLNQSPLDRGESRRCRDSRPRLLGFTATPYLKLDDISAKVLNSRFHSLYSAPSEVLLRNKASSVTKSLPALGGMVSGRDERQSRLGAKSIMQSAVMNGAASRAHRF